MEKVDDYIVIPEGFTCIEGHRSIGFIIKNQVDGSEFVWRPNGFDIDYPGRILTLEESEIPQSKRGVKTTPASIYSENYKSPTIPDGFEHLKGTWDTGYVIKNKADGSEFVWIPVGFLEADGTLDGINFNERFGRRQFTTEDIFSPEDYHEEVDTDFFESVKKYGGFYLSAFLASEGENDQIVFKKNCSVLNVGIWNEARKYAENYAKDNPNIVTRLPSGAIYDSVLKWIIQAKVKDLYEIAIDSSSWGNFAHFQNKQLIIDRASRTGSKEEWSVLNIYDLAGNFDEWTTEGIIGYFDEPCVAEITILGHTSKISSAKTVKREGVISRGGNCRASGIGFDWPVAQRSCATDPAIGYGGYNSFRCAFYLK